jgi:FKBP-type peptidyl-prolyl cis-trans isomerase
MKQDIDNKKHLLAVLLLLSFSLLIISCGNNDNTNNDEPLQYKKSLENANKKLVRTEDQEIEAYISRYGWDMIKTGTGLRYMIYQKGNGAEVRKGDLVKLKFNVTLINGSECYNSDKDGVKQIEIGKGVVESGLEEGLLLLRNKDKAKFIIPSHLAYGLLGDENKIPKRATLVYDVELIEVKVK